MLAGRAFEYHLFPFTYNELKSYFDLNQVLKFGSLPGLYFENDNDKSEILRAYVNTYLKEEIEIEAQIRNMGGFLRFLPIVAAQNGEIVNFSNISREAGIQYNTCRDYFKILEDIYLGFYLLPYGKSIRKKMTKKQ